MRKLAAWGGLFLLLYVLQSSFLPLVAWRRVSPDLLLLVVVSVSLLRGCRQGVFAGFMAGLLQDLATGTFLGTGILTKMLVGYSCGSFSQRLFREQSCIPVLAALASTVVQYLAMAGLVYMLGFRFDIAEHIINYLPPMLLMNVIFAYPVHKLVCFLADDGDDRGQHI